MSCLGAGKPDAASSAYEPDITQQEDRPSPSTPEAARAADVAARQPLAGYPSGRAPGSAAPPRAIVIQAQWRVSDFALAASRVETWVLAREGMAVMTNEHHLSITLPASAVPEFLQRFSSVHEADGPWPSGPIWVTISFELVP